MIQYKTHRYQLIKRAIFVCLLFFTAVSCAATHKPAKEEVNAKPAETETEKDLVVSEFILGVGDEVELRVYRHDDLNKKVRIPPDGINTFPLIGEIPTKGMSIHQLREKIKESLSVYLVDPQISLEITSFKGQKIFILGEVYNPGVYQIDTPTTIIEAIAKAGGYTLDGKYNSVVLIRGNIEKPELKRLDLKKTFATGDLFQNVFLKSGDIVYVPRTFISNVDRFFKHFENIVRPLVIMEQGILLGKRIDEEVFSGQQPVQRTQIVITPP